MIDGVIFDKDGTLFDFRKSWGGWATAFLNEIATDPDQARALGHAMGFDLDLQEFDATSPVIAGTPEDVAEVLLPHLPGASVTSLAAQMNAQSAAARMVPAVPLVEVLGDLRARGLKIGLATNDGEAPARAHVANAGVADLFDYVAGFDSGHGGKPAPGMLLAFAKGFGIDPARIVMVGDSLHDLDSGRAAGMKVVAVLTGIASAEVLAPHADAVLPDIGHLGAWIDGLSG